MLNSLWRILRVCAQSIRSLVRPRVELAFENIALRQQVMVLKDKKPRPKLQRADRLFWVMLKKVWSGWDNVLVIVKPETVVSWHRKGFKLFWTWKSHSRGRPTADLEVHALIRRMATENDWGAPRIHGELSKLGFDISERTVSRYMPRRKPQPEEINEVHLIRLVREYITYYHEDRTHLSLKKDTPNSRPVKKRPSEKAKVVSLPRVGGLHHRYGWSEAA